MLRFLRRCCESKRECLTYFIVILWIFKGVLATFYETNFNDLAAYFVSLTGFIASYIFGESVRKSHKSSIFLKGPTSKREVMIYIVIAIWLFLGSYSIVNQGDLVGISAYFAALTPFVGSYIIGETYKEEEDHDIIVDDIEQINS